MAPLLVSYRGREEPLPKLATPLGLDTLLPGGERWELEIGFGKGRYLLRRAESEPTTRFVGIELVSKYYRRSRDRVRKRGLDNVLLLRGEAQYLLSVALPRGFAQAVHVYFPDPWPKDRHHKRRLFEAGSVDLVLGTLGSRGRLLFATDALDYGRVVQGILERHGGLDVEVLDTVWAEGPRTNYEAKYVAAGRPILRLTAGLRRGGRPGVLHPDGRAAVAAAVREPEA